MKKIMNLFNVYENSKKVLSRKNLFYEEIYSRNKINTEFVVFCFVYLQFLNNHIQINIFQ